MVRLRPLALLLAASGAASLVYQVLWVKQLSTVVGVDVFAVSIGVASFFGGLALGSFAIGRAADSTSRPLRLYAALEVAVAVLGVATTIALSAIAAPFARAEASAGWVAWIVPVLLVALPAIPMGATLPVLVRTATPTPDRVGRPGGGLYAANTFGAIAGTLLVPFAAVPWLGVRGAAIAAAALNLAAAGGALALDRGVAAAGRTASAPGPSGARLAVVLYAVAGAIALGYEVVWTQAIVPFLSTRSFAFAIVLATHLAGLALGAALVARRVDRIRDAWGAFGLAIAAAGAVAMLTLGLLGGWLPYFQTGAEMAALAATRNTLAGMTARFAAAAACLVLVPTLLLGAAFPLALRLGASAQVGRDVGRVVALNTVGGIAGSLATGFVLVPALGLVRTLAGLALAAAVVGAIAAMRGRSRARIAIASVAAITLGAALLVPRDHLARIFAAARRGSLAFYDEDRGGTVAVLASGGGSKTFHRLYIQGVSNSGDALPSLRYMRLQALLPLLVHRGEPRSALVIGLGTGITAGALLADPTLERRVAAELLPAVVRATPLFTGNFGAGRDPRLEIRVRDGRRELLRSDERYDVITLEPPPPSAAGVANLYSSDFYALAASRLEPGGLVAQWLPIATQNVDDTRSLVRSFLDVFPHASLWTTEVHEMLLLGSFEPIELDAARVAPRFDAAPIRAALAEVGVATPEALLATWITDRDGLARFAADAPPVTDDRPRIEYAAWVRPDEIERALPALLALATPPSLANAAPSFADAVRRERERLHAFYDAALHAYRGEREAWSDDLSRVLREDGSNPYYRWFAGGSQ